MAVPDAASCVAMAMCTEACTQMPGVQCTCAGACSHEGEQAAVLAAQEGAQGARGAAADVH